jgi:hypothetical protein
MRLPVLLALIAVPAALVACRPDYPPGAVQDPHYAAPTVPDRQYAPPSVQDPAYTAPQTPPAPPAANGPPTVIIQPAR